MGDISSLSHQIKYLQQRCARLRCEIRTPISDEDLKAVRSKSEKLKELEPRVHSLQIQRLALCSRVVKEDDIDVDSIVVAAGVVETLKKGAKKAADATVSMTKDGLRFANDVRSLIISLERLNEWLLENKTVIVENAALFWSSMAADPQVDKDRLQRLRLKLFSLFSNDTMRESLLAPVTSSNNMKYIMKTLGSTTKLRTADSAKHLQLASRLKAIVTHSQDPTSTLSFDQIDRAAQLAVAIMYRLRDSKDNTLPDINADMLALFMGQPDGSVSAMFASAGITVNSALVRALPSRMVTVAAAAATFIGADDDDSTLPTFRAIRMHSSLGELQRGEIGDIPHTFPIYPALSSNPERKLAAEMRALFAAKPMTAQEAQVLKMIAFQKATEDTKNLQIATAIALDTRHFSLRTDPFDPEKMSVPSGVQELVSSRAK